MPPAVNPLTRTVDGRELPAVGRWEFESGNSSIDFLVKHMVISKVRGSFRKFSGTIEVAESPEKSTAEVTIESASIDTGMPYRDKDLRGEHFLDVETHPHIQFRTLELTPKGRTWALTGNLTIAGKTNPVVLTLEFQGAAIDPWGNEKAVFSANTSIERETWGLTWNQALEAGGMLIGSTIVISMEIQAKPVR